MPTHKKWPYILLGSLLLCQIAAAQDYFSLMAWNVENLFDTIHDEGKRDEEFLPQGSRRWSRYRFYRKLQDIGKTIVAVDSVQPIDIVGLCEVENDTVMVCMTERTRLHKLGYRYVMTHSEDERGIDVALLYAPMRFRMLAHESIRAKTSKPVRDVLYATGTIPKGDTLDVYLVHLPSKRGGLAADRNRQAVIGKLLEHADSICHIRKQANIVIMGDFNDELRAGRWKPFRQRGFKDIVQGKRPGTYKYQGTWNTLDHILLKSSSFHAESDVAAPGFLLEEDKTNGGEKPFRTYLGPRYNGGISDHLPVWLRLSPKPKN